MLLEVRLLPEVVGADAALEGSVLLLPARLVGLEGRLVGKDLQAAGALERGCVTARSGDVLEAAVAALDSSVLLLLSVFLIFKVT